MTFYPHRPPAVHRKRVEARRRVAIGLAVLTTSVLTLATGTLFANGAHAAPRAVIAGEDSAALVHRVIRVSYRDLDLAQPKHVLILKKRLTAAARKLCASSPEMFGNDLSFPPGCVFKALADGNRQIDRAVAVAVQARRDAVLASDAEAAGVVARPL